MFKLVVSGIKPRNNLLIGPYYDISQVGRVMKPYHRGLLEKNPTVAHTGLEIGRGRSDRPRIGPQRLNDEGD